MRRSPTLGFCVLLMGLVAVGCAAATDEESGDKSNDVGSTNGAPQQEGEPASPPDAPPFEASFDQHPSTPDPSKTDPAPPDAAQCIDNDDAGGTENVAMRLPDTDDCDNEYKTVSGVIKGAVDVDVYKLSGADKGISISHPFGCQLDTDFVDETEGTELCVYVRCKNSTLDAVSGCAEGVESTSDIGMKGCCAAAPGRAVPKWDCGGFPKDQSADFFFKVRQANANQCLPYTVKYRY